MGELGNNQETRPFDPEALKDTIRKMQENLIVSDRVPPGEFWILPAGKYEGQEITHISGATFRFEGGQWQGPFWGVKG